MRSRVARISARSRVIRRPTIVESAADRVDRGVGDRELQAAQQALALGRAVRRRSRSETNRGRHVVARLAAGADGSEARELVERGLELGGRDAQLEEPAGRAALTLRERGAQDEAATAVGCAEDRVGEVVELVRDPPPA